MCMPYPGICTGPCAALQAGRDEAAVAKAFKDEALAAKRALLKAAFLSQQLQALKAGKQQQQQKAAVASGGSSSKAGGSSHKGA